MRYKRTIWADTCQFIPLATGYAIKTDEMQHSRENLTKKLKTFFSNVAIHLQLKQVVHCEPFEIETIFNDF